MKKLLVTGGTVFVSKSIAEYFADKGYDVYVLNRDNHEQLKGVTLIQTDRHDIGEKLKDHYFDVVVDTAYTSEDVSMLHDSLDGYGDYILISSSAVYPETLPQPFTEDMKTGPNQIWGKYGTDKIAAENALMERNPNAYILRPPYLYGPYNNLYREAFVFDCAMQDRKFYLPKDGSMKLQFFHIHDLCKLIDAILQKKPDRHIYNVGNKETISVFDWVTLCYQVAGKEPQFVQVHEDIMQRQYFSFYDYDYCLDVSAQYELMACSGLFATSKNARGELVAEAISMEEGLKQSYEWYKENEDQVWKKPHLEFIDRNL
ncbi:MAG: NAD-dependent epimerase/dehydratase family protein [Lachnospiraceae bacterium]|nr:NAD-dependent epimerase/dehydratase family protein [Lachnospiraceae bacterium]